MKPQDGCYYWIRCAIGEKWTVAQFHRPNHAGWFKRCDDPTWYKEGTVYVHHQPIEYPNAD